MQTKSVILTIGAIAVAGIAIVLLLGRTPTYPVSETAAVEQSAPADETSTATTTGEDVSEPTAIPESQQAIADEEAANTETATADDATAAAVSAEEPAASEDTAAATEDKPAAEVSDKPAADAAAAEPAATTDDTSLLSGPASTKVDVEKAMEERSLGKADAPVTIIEYASMTCPHCAHFNNAILPEIKKQLIETGKARIVYRDFPLDNVATRAAAMARCADHDKYFDLVEVIFKDQERWIQSSDPLKALAQLGTLAGMDEDYIKACMGNPELNAAILKNMQDGQKQYTIKSTPTFIFNDGAQKLDGAKDFQPFVEIVNRLSSGK